MTPIKYEIWYSKTTSCFWWPKFNFFSTHILLYVIGATAVSSYHCSCGWGEWYELVVLQLEIGGVRCSLVWKTDFFLLTNFSSNFQLTCFKFLSETIKKKETYFSSDDSTCSNRFKVTNLSILKYITKLPFLFSYLGNFGYIKVLFFFKIFVFILLDKMWLRIYSIYYVWSLFIWQKKKVHIHI